MALVWFWFLLSNIMLCISGTSEANEADNCYRSLAAVEHDVGQECCSLLVLHLPGRPFPTWLESHRALSYKIGEGKIQ